MNTTETSSSFDDSADFQALQKAANSPMEFLGNPSEGGQDYPNISALETSLGNSREKAVNDHAQKSTDGVRRLEEKYAQERANILQQFQYPSKDAPEAEKTRWEKGNSVILEELNKKESAMKKEVARLQEEHENMKLQTGDLYNAALRNLRAAFSAREKAQELVMEDIARMITDTVVSLPKSRSRGGRRSRPTSQPHLPPAVQSLGKSLNVRFTNEESKAVTAGVLAALPDAARADFMKHFDGGRGRRGATKKIDAPDIYAHIVSQFIGEKVSGESGAQNTVETNAWDEALKTLQPEKVGADSAEKSPQNWKEAGKDLAGKIMGDTTLPPALKGMLLNGFLNVPEEEKVKAVARTLALYEAARSLKLPDSLKSSGNVLADAYHAQQIFHILQNSPSAGPETLAVLTRYEHMKELIPESDRDEGFNAIENALATSVLDVGKMKAVLDAVEQAYREKKSLELKERYKEANELYRFFTGKPFLSEEYMASLQAPETNLESFQAFIEGLVSPQEVAKQPEVLAGVTAAARSFDEKTAVIRQFQEALPKRVKKLPQKKKAELMNYIVTKDWKLFSEMYDFSAPDTEGQLARDVYATAYDMMGNNSPDFKVDYDKAVAGLGILGIAPIVLKEEAGKAVAGKKPAGSGVKNGGGNSGGGREVPNGNSSRNPRESEPKAKAPEASEIPEAPEFIAKIVKDAVENNTFSPELTDPWATERVGKVEELVSTELAKNDQWKKEDVGKRYRVAVTINNKPEEYVLEKQVPKTAEDAKPEEKLAVRLEKVDGGSAAA